MNNRENIIWYRDIGQVRYVQNRRAKNLSIRINQLGEVRMTVPGFVSRRRAEAFLLSKQGWILKKLSEINRLNQSGLRLEEGDIMNIRGKSVPIVLKNGELSVEDAIWRILLKEAQDYLPGRVKQLAASFGFEYAGVKIRKMKTRWGSCNSKNGINLNSWLIMLPETLSDYVILHELMHTQHRHHGREFWEALDRITPVSSKTLRRELREQRILSVDPKNQFRGEINGVE